MINNKTFIKHVLDSTKDLDNKKEIIKTTTNTLEDCFESGATIIKLFGLKDISLSYETGKESVDTVTPEVLSLLEELYLSADTSQYDSGSYYTNKSLVNRTLSEIPDIKNKKIIDPASGTGNFLINVIISLKNNFLSKKDFVEYLSNYVFANDLMESSTNTYIKRLNFLSINWFNEGLTEKDLLLIKANISNKDFLLDFSKEQEYDIIIGNPPYLGTKSLGKDYLDKLNKEFGFTDDLYSLFTIKSLNLLSESGFFSFVTSNTYFTLKTKLKMRESLVKNGLYKIINNNKSHFGIMTNTSTFFVDRKTKADNVIMVQESNKGVLETTNTLKIEKIKNSDYRFAAKQTDNIELSSLFERSMAIYEKYKAELSTSKKLSKFKETKEYDLLTTKNDVLPLGLVAFIGTGVDFKGNNKKVLHSLTNKKYQIIEKSEIKEDLTKADFQNGIQGEDFKYIKAIKGNEIVYVKWDQEMFRYLKEIKAPLRNLHLYGSNMIYCKTSTYELTKIDKNTLCINTAGACFIKPIIDIDINSLFEMINKEEIKDYIKTNINNSLSFTPNDLKFIPIKIR